MPRSRQIVARVKQLSPQRARRQCEDGSVTRSVPAATYDHEAFALWTLVNTTIFVREVHLMGEGGAADLDEPIEQNAFLDDEAEEDLDPELAKKRTR